MAANALVFPDVAGRHCTCDNPGDRAPCACRQGMMANPKRKEKGMRTICFVVPEGFFSVDADALRRARQEVPDGEFHVAR